MGYYITYDRESNKWYERHFPVPSAPWLATGQAQAYKHDDIYRLTDARYGVNDNDIDFDANKTTDNPVTWGASGYRDQMNYAIDRAGNWDLTTWLAPSEDPVYTDYFANELNQYEQVGDVEYTHDANGNLTNNGSWDFYYSSANQLVHVRKASNDHTYFRFDALGRRVYKKVSDGIQLGCNFWYDGQQVLMGDYGENLYVYGIGIDEPVMLCYKEFGAYDRYFYHRNQLGSVTCITDDPGDVKERYTYDAYGEPTIRNASGTEISSSLVTNPYMFTGRRWDANLELYHYRARAYNPATGRFLQRDQFEDPNLYGYVNNMPTFYVDPTGEIMCLAFDPDQDTVRKKFLELLSGCGEYEYSLSQECCPAAFPYKLGFGKHIKNKWGIPQGASHMITDITGSMSGQGIYKFKVITTSSPIPFGRHTADFQWIYLNDYDSLPYNPKNMVINANTNPVVAKYKVEIPSKCEYLVHELVEQYKSVKMLPKAQAQGWTVKDLYNNAHAIAHQWQNIWRVNLGQKYIAKGRQGDASIEYAETETSRARFIVDIVMGKGGKYGVRFRDQQPRNKP